MIWHFVTQFWGQRLLNFSATIIQFFGHDLGPFGGFLSCAGVMDLAFRLFGVWRALPWIHVCRDVRFTQFLVN